jgi:CRISPR-associated protein Csd1
MILQALYNLDQRERLRPDPDYEPKKVAWLIRISPDGNLQGIEGTHTIPNFEGKKPKPVPKTFKIPKQPLGKAGIKAPPSFFVDNAKYVFGMSTKDKKFSIEEGREKSGWFLEEISKCANETKDEASIAVCNFLQAVRLGQISVKLPDECKSNDLFAFVYSPDVDILVHERPKIRSYWKAKRHPNRDVGSQSDLICLVSGKKTNKSGLFPLIEKVPGASPSRIALVSFNKPAFKSYGWDGNENAPISRDSAEACATAMNRLLDPAYPDPLQLGQTLPSRHLRLSADTAVCFWAAETSGDEFASVFSGLLESNPEAVRNLYHTIWRGRSPDMDNPTAFYALTLTGTQGRIIVRDWFESTVQDVAKNLARYFNDIDIVWNTPKPKDRDLPPQLPFSLLLESIADPADNRREGIPAPLSSRLLRAVFTGIPYPLAVLQRSLQRYRAEIGNDQDTKNGWRTKRWNDARAGLIKAVLNCRKRILSQTSHMEVKCDMNPINMSQGYTLGCLMAVLERLQQEALSNVNATVVDRYFSGASASPKSVFVRLLKNARHHVSKAKDQADKGGIVFLIDKLIDDLADRFDPKHNGFPAHLDLEQQGLFVLGFHQMRKWLWMTKEEREKWEKEYPDAPRAFLWSKAK